MAYGYIEHPYLQLLSWLMVAVRIDDPVDAIAVHGAGGLVGILSVPIFMEVQIVQMTCFYIFLGDPFYGISKCIMHCAYNVNFHNFIRVDYMRVTQIQQWRLFESMLREQGKIG